MHLGDHHWWPIRRNFRWAPGVRCILKAQLGLFQKHGVASNIPWMKDIPLFHSFCAMVLGRWPILWGAFSHYSIAHPGAAEYPGKITKQLVTGPVTGTMGIGGTVRHPKKSPVLRVSGWFELLLRLLDMGYWMTIELLDDYRIFHRFESRTWDQSRSLDKLNLGKHRRWRLRRFDIFAQLEVGISDSIWSVVWLTSILFSHINWE